MTRKTTETSDVREADITELYRRQDADRQLIVQTREEVAGVRSTLSEVSRTLDKIATRVHSPPSPTNWVGIAILVVSVIVAASSYFQSRISPIERLVNIHDDEIRSNLPKMGRYEAELDAQRDNEARLHERIKELEARRK